jgi:hypothetical protein
LAARIGEKKKLLMGKERGSVSESVILEGASGMGKDWVRCKKRAFPHQFFFGLDNSTRRTPCSGACINPFAQQSINNSHHESSPFHCACSFAISNNLCYLHSPGSLVYRLPFAGRFDSPGLWVRGWLQNILVASLAQAVPEPPGLDTSHLTLLLTLRKLCDDCALRNSRRLPPARNKGYLSTSNCCG